MTYDPQPFHVDRAAAAEGPFGGIVASGFQTRALAFRAFYDSNIIKSCSMGSPGIDELRWLAPVRPGDTLHVEAEVKQMRASRSKPDRGVLQMTYTAKNQDDEVVLTFTAIHLFARKPA